MENEMNYIYDHAWLFWAMLISLAIYVIGAVIFIVDGVYSDHGIGGLIAAAWLYFTVWFTFYRED